LEPDCSSVSMYGTARSRRRSSRFFSLLTLETLLVGGSIECIRNNKLSTLGLQKASVVQALTWPRRLSSTPWSWIRYGCPRSSSGCRAWREWGRASCTGDRVFSTISSYSLELVLSSGTHSHRRARVLAFRQTIERRTWPDRLQPE
jgi:hypothetical protein